MHDSPLYDAVIAGAGPVGLFLACELRLAGLSVLVLEQADNPHSPLKRLPFGMRGLSIPSVEAFYRRGLLDDIATPRGAEYPSGRDSASLPHWMRQSRRAGGHFAGIQFYDDRIDTAQWPYRLSNPASAGMASDMAHIESVLAARATTMGVEVRGGFGVEGYEQSDDDVTIRAGGQTLRARWLVGCDGGRSTVRKAGGFEFIGTEPEFTGYSVEVEMADPEQLVPGRHYTPTGMYTYQQPGTIAMIDFDGGAFHRSESITREHVQSVLRHISGTDVSVTALHLATTWTDRAYQATAYRKGRVLLAGDAAHIHSPLGGQGLNLGLGDAMNLGWKLAATIRGDAPDGLPDSYASERHPLGARILDWSRAQVPSCGQAAVRARSRPSSVTSSTRATARPISRNASGAYRCATIWAMPIHCSAAAPPTWRWPMAPGWASISKTARACYWTWTPARHYKRWQDAGASASCMLPALPATR